MSSFTKHPPLQPLPGGKLWKVIEAFEYHVGNEDSNEVIKVPEGFITDFASIPRIFWSIIGGPWGKYGYAAIVHDKIYWSKECSRKRADFIFLDAMKTLGVKRYRRNLMYWAVRIGARWVWKRRVGGKGVRV